MPSKIVATITPLTNYEPRTIGLFKTWTHSAIPGIYSNALSHYENLTRVVFLLNEVIVDINHCLEAVGILDQNVSNLNFAFYRLQNYVNDFEANVEEYIEKTDNRIKVLEIFHETQERLNTAVANHFDKLDGNVKDLDTRIETIEGIINDLIGGDFTELINEVKELVEEAKQSAEEAKQSSTEAKEAANNAVTEVEKVKNDIENINSWKDSASGTISQLVESNAITKGKIYQIEVEQISQNEKIESVESWKNNASATITNLAENVQSLNDKQQKNETDISNLKLADIEHNARITKNTENIEKSLYSYENVISASNYDTLGISKITDIPFNKAVVFATNITEDMVKLLPSYTGNQLFCIKTQYADSNSMYIATKYDANIAKNRLYIGISYSSGNAVVWTEINTDSSGSSNKQIITGFKYYESVESNLKLDPVVPVANQGKDILTYTGAIGTLRVADVPGFPTTGIEYPALINVTAFGYLAIGNSTNEEIVAVPTTFRGRAVMRESSDVYNFMGRESPAIAYDDRGNIYIFQMQLADFNRKICLKTVATNPDHGVLRIINCGTYGVLDGTSNITIKAKSGWRFTWTASHMDFNDY